MAILAADPRPSGDPFREKHDWRPRAEYADATGQPVTLSEPWEELLANTPWDWLLEDPTLSLANVHMRFPLSAIRESTGELLRFDGTSITRHEVRRGTGIDPVVSHLPVALDRLERVAPALAERIRFLAKLGPNWDGYGAVSISRMAMRRCADFLIGIYQASGFDPDPCFIAPLADGGLELEWEWQSGNELMVVIPPSDGPVEFLATTIDPSSGDEIEREGIIPANPLLRDLLTSLSA